MAIKSGNKDLSVYCDLEGHTIAGGTIPPNVLPTAQKPDLVLYWPQEQNIVIIELTVPFECNTDQAHNHKTTKYEQLVSDINNTMPCELLC